ARVFSRPSSVGPASVGNLEQPACCRSGGSRDGVCPYICCLAAFPIGASAPPTVVVEQWWSSYWPIDSSGMISSATMLMILISGLTAGPAVSLYGSPTVSPVTAALCASEFLPPKLPSSMYFLALSQAPPPVVMEMATNRPVTMVPISTPPSATGPRIRPTRIGTTTGSSDGMIISLIADLVSMSTARSYLGFEL